VESSASGTEKSQDIKVSSSGSVSHISMSLTGWPELFFIVIEYVTLAPTAGSSPEAVIIISISAGDGSGVGVFVDVGVIVGV